MVSAPSNSVVEENNRNAPNAAFHQHVPSTRHRQGLPDSNFAQFRELALSSRTLIVSPEAFNGPQMYFMPNTYYAWTTPNRWFGPFAVKPTRATLPCGSTYVIMKKMQVELMGMGAPRSFFRFIEELTVPRQEYTTPRVLPQQLPGVRRLTREELNLYERPLIPGLFYARSATKQVGPFIGIPAAHQLPHGESYIIFQELGRMSNGVSIVSAISQLDRH